MKGNLIIMGCFAAGIAAARMDLLPAWLLSHDVPVYILSALIFQVGIGLGASNDLQRMKQSFGAGMILLPAATIIGTLSRISSGLMAMVPMMFSRASAGGVWSCFVSTIAPFNSRFF